MRSTEPWSTRGVGVSSVVGDNFCHVTVSENTHYSSIKAEVIKAEVIFEDCS